MTHGVHVTLADCREIRRRVDAGWAVTMVAREMDLNTDTVNYHLHGHCAHDHDA